MMGWLLIAGFAIASNLDNVGAGVAFGVGRIRISPTVNLWIAVITFVVTLASVAGGHHLAHLLPGHVAAVLSATAFCGMGLWMIGVSVRERRNQRVMESATGPLLVSVLEAPARADSDHSRHIDFREATVLGAALSLNNIGGGIGVGLAHLSPLATSAAAGAASFAVIWIGCVVGERFGGRRLGDHAQMAAGALLLLIGVFQLR